VLLHDDLRVSLGPARADPRGAIFPD